MAVQTAYVHHAKAYQAARIQARMAEAAQIGYELTQAFHDAGNVTQRELLAARAEASEAKLRALDAEWSSIEARESLLRVMGVRSAAISLAALAALPLGGHRALSLGFAAGNRNLGLLLAILPATADPALALFLALGQFPIYLLPWLMTPLYRRLVPPHRSG